MQRSLGLQGWEGVGVADGAGRLPLWRRLRVILMAAAVLLGILVMARLNSPHASPRAEPSARPWAGHLSRAEEALARRDFAAAQRAWHAASLAALAARRWEGRLAVGDASLMVGGTGWGAGDGAARARDNYLAALLLAREQRSLDGVLRVAEAFAALGDGDMVEASLRIADELAGDDRDPRARGRVQAFRERPAARPVDAANAQ